MGSICTSNIRRAVIWACLVAGLGGCSDPVDKAAKERIFSPEDPPRAVSSAKERLPPEEVADDPRIARRVLGMGAAEATERLGPHKLTAQVTFEWLDNGGRKVKLEETRTLLAGPGGFSGDFHATIENSRNQGLEVIRAGGEVYARSRHGKFRHRKRDRGVAERERDQVYSAMREFDSLFQGRVVLKPVGTVTVNGRTAWKYDVDLAPSAPAVGEPAKLPPPAFARTGPDEDTKRRLAFFEKRTPQSLDGEVLVDADTSTVVKARLDGTITAPGAEEGSTATLRLALTNEVTEIGKDPKIAAPVEFFPDADKPQGIADALDQFGIPRGGADAGTPAPTAAEPEDEG